VRRRAVAEALGDEAGHGGGHLWAQKEHLVVGIEELERGVAQLRFLHDLRVLERGCDHLPKPVHSEALQNPRLHIQ
jgi:hypothetical protein